MTVEGGDQHTRITLENTRPGVGLLYINLSEMF